uniref:Uncharacterized protein MANES_15G182500 n=1 Tax=Rhizophora mucronata TaxID=61149 RepID=A0A2P2J270_RHIMU
MRGGCCSRSRLPARRSRG